MLKPALSLATAGLTFLCFSSPASGAAFGASWQMNELSGPMLDSSGNGNNSSSIGAGITQNGSSYHFSGIGNVLVPSSASLVPGAQPFTLTVRLHLDKIADENFVQKNTHNVGNQIKLETSGKHLHCRVAGSTGVASVWGFGASPTLLSGFHTVSCSKTDTSVTLTLDRRSWTQNIAVGNVNTKAPFTIGGKSPCLHPPTGCDYTFGSIDYVTLTSP